MFKIALLNVEWQNESLDRPLFKNDVARDDFFNTLATFFGGFTDLMNVTLEDQINFDVVMQRDGDVEELLSRNYAVLKYPSGKVRYYFAKVVQDVNNQYQVSLTLDDYVTNYEKIKKTSKVMVKRASYKDFKFGFDSILNIPELIDEKKYHKNRIPLKWRFNNQYLNEVLANEIWVYFFIKPNEYMSNFNTYKVEGIDTKHIVLVAPLSKLWQIKGTTNIDWSVLNIVTQLTINTTLQNANANMDILRVSTGTGVPTGVTTLTTNLMSFVTNVKISPYPPFNTEDGIIQNGDKLVIALDSVVKREYKPFNQSIGKLPNSITLKTQQGDFQIQNFYVDFGDVYTGSGKSYQSIGIRFVEYDYFVNFPLVNDAGDYSNGITFFNGYTNLSTRSNLFIDSNNGDGKFRCRLLGSGVSSDIVTIPKNVLVNMGVDIQSGKFVEDGINYWLITVSRFRGFNIGLRPEYPSYNFNVSNDDFNINLIGVNWDYNLGVVSTISIVQGSTATLQSITDPKQATIVNVLVLEQNRKYSFSLLMNNTPTKFNSSEFKEYRIVNHKGDYFTIDLNKLNGGNIIISIYEELSADATDTFITIFSDEFSIYEFNDVNYNGIVSNTDNGIPMFIDALSEYFATNKNAIQSYELERQTISQQAESDKKFATQQKQTSKQTWGYALSFGGFGVDAVRKSNELKNEKAQIDRGATLNENKSIMQQSYALDNLQYSPPKISGIGNIIFNKKIMGILPVIDVYEVEDIVYRKYELYFENFGYSFGLIYSLEELDLQDLPIKYLECDLLETKAKISGEEFSRLKVLLNAGVKRRVIE